MIFFSHIFITLSEGDFMQPLFRASMAGVDDTRLLASLAEN